MIQLADGCLCCTVRGELVDTLADLVDRLQTGRIARLSRVVVETTGPRRSRARPAGDHGASGALQAFRLDGVITVVDAVNGRATLDAHVEAVRQVAVADRIVSPRRISPRPPPVAALTARLAAGINPGASTSMAARPEASAAALFACGLYDPATKTADVRRWLGEPCARS